MHTIEGIQNKGDQEIKGVKATVIKKYEKDNAEYSFHLPYLLAKGPNGEVIVGNNSEKVHHLVVFDEKLKVSKIIGGEGDGNGKFRFIRGIALDKEGYLYVTDGKLDCIQKFTLNDGKFISQFGNKGSQNGEFNKPAGMLISQSNFLFVCDRKNDRIQVFCGDKFLFKIEGNFSEPVDLAFNNSETELFVTNWRNHKIQAYTPLGVPLKSVNIPGNFTLHHPNGIYFTSDGRLLVSALDYVYILKDNTWSAIKPIIESATNPQSAPIKPGDYIGVLMMNNGNILITDGINGKNQLILINYCTN